ncbi:MAG: MMPL family transporter [Polyangiaceae bacterium]
MSTLFVVLETPATEDADPKALRAAGDALVAEIRKIPEPYVGNVEDGIQDAMAFLEPRVGLAAKTEDLRGLRADVEARFKYEIAKASDALLEDNGPPPLDEASVKARLHLDDQKIEKRYPDGYFQSEDGRTLVVSIRSKILGTDTQRGGKAIDLVRDAIRAVDLASYHPRMTFGFSGDLYSGVVEVGAMNQDLSDVGILGAILIAGIVLVFYLRVRTLFVMVSTIAIGMSWTAGLTFFTVRQLNVGTSFVFTIIAGNGLNSAVIYMARFLEARRDGSDVEGAIREAHQGTFLATAAACAASSASFASLLTTTFRGFRELGMVGAYGLTLCWIATVLCLPSILAVTERFAPIKVGESATKTVFGRIRAAWNAGFGRPFAWIVERAPRAVAVTGIALAVAGFVGLVFYVKQDPMEYDLENMRNDRKTRATEERFKKLADEITGYVGADGMAMLVDDPSDVAPLRAKLYAIRDAAPPELRPFGALYALEDLVPDEERACTDDVIGADEECVTLPADPRDAGDRLAAMKREAPCRAWLAERGFCDRCKRAGELVCRPKGAPPLPADWTEACRATEIDPDEPKELASCRVDKQTEKIELLLTIKQYLEKMHAKKGISEDDWAKIARFLPPADVAPLTIHNLPEGIARTFTETDGTRGRIVFISPTSPELTEDARYLLRWAASYRRTELPNGKVVLGSGRAVIYADMWTGVLAAVPIATIASIIAVTIVVLVAFRGRKSALTVMAALGVGIGWMAGVLVILKMKLNFLNFVALPITFGIGVEYAVNIVYRYTREGRGGAPKAMRETGGAVVLCSMTTILGYGALSRSMNFAVRSLGLVAVIGEVCTLLAAMLVLPAVLVWRDQKFVAARASKPDSAEPIAEESAA